MFVYGCKGSGFSDTRTSSSGPHDGHRPSLTRLCVTTGFYLVCDDVMMQTYFKSGDTEGVWPVWPASRGDRGVRGSTSVCFIASHDLIDSLVNC